MIKCEEFKKAIKALKNFDRDMEPFDKVLKVDGPWCELFDETVKLLALCLCEGTKLEYNFVKDDLGYFIYECLYGDAWCDGMMKDENDNPIDWSTPEKFYEYQKEQAAL